VQGKSDELLLGAVVEVALESSSLGDGCIGDPRIRGGQLVVGLRALERERDQLREAAQALLCVRGERLADGQDEERPQVRPPAMTGAATEDR
jgi:hypothetical protein